MLCAFVFSQVLSTGENDEQEILLGQILVLSILFCCLY
jgi:hypothetical protein